MLYIHGTLVLGGIETFFVRIAKERAATGKKTILLLLSDERKNNKNLVAEAREYADVYFITDVTWLPSIFFLFIPFHLLLLVPLRASIKEIFNNCKSVHVANGICAFFCLKIFRYLSKEPVLTMGLYHSKEYCWGGSSLPYFEKKNREFFFHVISKNNIVFFNEALVDTYSEFTNTDFSKVNLFPLGVIESRNVFDETPKPSSDDLSIVSIGRLVRFKSYNIHMIHVVKKLKDMGVSIRYVVYGEGPLSGKMKELIAELELENEVELKGRLDYSNFASTVKQFDIFVGSGTAIVEAASLGVPSIVGIENIELPETYGYFSDIPGFSYNEDGLYPKTSIFDVVMHYRLLNPLEILELRNKNFEKAQLFSIQNCAANFEKMKSQQIDSIDIRRFSSIVFRVKYAISLFLTSFFLRIKGTSLSDYTRR